MKNLTKIHQLRKAHNTYLKKLTICEEKGALYFEKKA
jgi:hypothetical protein